MSNLLVRKRRGKKKKKKKVIVEHYFISEIIKHFPHLIMFHKKAEYTGIMLTLWTFIIEFFITLSKLRN